MKISVFVGDITEAPAEAVCTSTNPRLSLMMGTGGAVRERGGFEVLRAAEAFAREEAQRTGKRGLPVGTVVATAAGRLPYKKVIHCVAADGNHLSSIAIVRACTKNALVAAERAGCRSVALPLFGTGHSHLPFGDVLAAMVDVLRNAGTSLDEAVLVVIDPDREKELRAAILP